jgi:hypothetical protein
LDDGTPWWSIAGSFLVGVARERALRRPTLRIGSTVAALILGIAAPLALFASLTPASASGTNVTREFSRPGEVARQLESTVATHRFQIAVVERAVPTDVYTRRLRATVGVATTSKVGALLRAR